MQKILKCAHHLHETEEKTIDDEGMAGEGGGGDEWNREGNEKWTVKVYGEVTKRKIGWIIITPEIQKKLTVVVIAVRIKHNDDSSFKLINEKSANLKIIHTSMNFAEF